MCCILTEEQMLAHWEEQRERERKWNEYMDSLDVNNIDTIPSATEFFDVIQVLMKEGEWGKQEALRIILGEIGGYEEYEVCNDFLKLIYDKLDDTDVIFHILHKISNIRDELPFYNEFIIKCRKVITEKRGEKVANTLMEVSENPISERQIKIIERRKRRKYGKR